MSAVGFWPVAVVPVGRVACATTLWMTRGRLNVTVVVKARFRIVPNGVMTPILPEPVRPQHGELAPYLGQADVVLTAGKAYPRDASPVPALGVRLALYREWALVDKSLLVYPRDAEGRRAHAVSGPIAVVGRGRERGGMLVNPQNPSHPGSLGPLAADAPERVSLLVGAAAPSAQRGVYTLPDMFPWAYFQVAPVDQRAGYLQGDEWVVVDGMHPQHGRLQSRLPNAIAQVYAYPPGLTAGSSYPVAMQADQLLLDVERLECSLLWRGSFPVVDEATARSLVLLAGVAMPGLPVLWPRMPELQESPVLRAQGLVRAIGHAPPAAVDGEDAESSAKTVVRSPQSAAALFAELEADQTVPMGGAPAAEATIPIHEARAPGTLATTKEGLLTIRKLSASLLLELEAEDTTPEEVALAEPDDSLILSPEGLGARKSAPPRPEPAKAPIVPDVTVDELENTLSDALLARGLKLEEIYWTDDGEA